MIIVYLVLDGIARLVIVDVLQHFVKDIILDQHHVMVVVDQAEHAIRVVIAFLIGDGITGFHFLSEGLDGLGFAILVCQGDLMDNRRVFDGQREDCLSRRTVS